MPTTTRTEELLDRLGRDLSDRDYADLAVACADKAGLNGQSLHSLADQLAHLQRVAERAPLPASRRIAACFKPNVNGVPARTMIEIREWDMRAGSTFAATAIIGNVAESTRWRSTAEAAIEYARSLGYTEIVRS